MAFAILQAFFLNPTIMFARIADRMTYYSSQFQLKKITAFTLTFIGVCMLIYMGIEGMAMHKSFGPFFIFLGSCTAVGLTIDIVTYVKERIRQENIRKLGY